MRILFYTGFIALLLISDGEVSFAQHKPAINKALMLELINNAREKGCNCGEEYMPPAPKLKWNSMLEKAAQIQSNDMYRKKYFDHVSPNGKSTLRTRIKRVNYKWAYIAENIAHGYMDTKEVVEGWLNSPNHCKNIMNPNYKEIGAAVKGNYWTQVFGAPKP